MRTEICDRLGIEFPIFAFTHCRDVVAAVSKAGGFGVLGAVGFPPEQLEIELQAGSTSTSATSRTASTSSSPASTRAWARSTRRSSRRCCARRSPSSTASFADKILADHGVPKLPEGERPVDELLGWTAATATPQVEVALTHPKVKLIANALGTPPDDVIERDPRAGRLVAALCGVGEAGARAQGGRRRHHHRAGHRGRRPHRRDRQRRAVARGDRRGRADAGARRRRHRHRPADRRRARDGRAGRVDRLALAHRGGSRRAAGAERRLSRRRPARTRCARARSPASRAACCATTGPRRGRRPDSPKPLGMPLQFMVTADAVARGHRYADKAKDVMFNPVGQIVGQMNKRAAGAGRHLRPRRGVPRSRRAAAAAVAVRGRVIVTAP